LLNVSAYLQYVVENFIECKIIFLNIPQACVSFETILLLIDVLFGYSGKRNSRRVLLDALPRLLIICCHTNSAVEEQAKPGLLENCH